MTEYGVVAPKRTSWVLDASNPPLLTLSVPGQPLSRPGITLREVGKFYYFPLNQSPMAALINCHKLGSPKQYKFILSQLRRLEL